MVSSRLIERLDAAIAAEAAPLAREYLRAERAGAMARLGLLADARFALDGLRRQNQRHKDPLLAAWAHLVEGQADCFDALDDRTASVHFQAALEVAESIGHRPIQALASAWLANCALNATDLPAMQLHAQRARQWAEPRHHAAQARLGLTLAFAHCWSGDEASAQAWYLRARSHASADGDSAMISAMLHNIASMRSGQIALDDAFDRADLDQARKALLETESTANYDDGIGVASLSSFVPVIRAQLLIVLGRFDEAVLLFDRYLDQVCEDGMVHRRPRFLADRAWGLVHAGRDVTRAMSDAQAAEAGAGDQRDADDRAATFARLARLHRQGGREARAEALQQRAAQALVEHQAEQAQGRAALQGLMP